MLLYSFGVAVITNNFSGIGPISVFVPVLIGLCWKSTMIALNAAMNSNEEIRCGKQENAQKIRMGKVAGLLSRRPGRPNCISGLRGCVCVELQRRKRRRADLPLGCLKSVR
ncbi:hypothetical protein TSMEX_009896 [Taenia solium]|eukprot:TsM_000862500 transcript=TsM_000862500 gene=TsM_000862500